jgi:hypothetical protein
MDRQTGLHETESNLELVTYERLSLSVRVYEAHWRRDIVLID